MNTQEADSKLDLMSGIQINENTNLSIEFEFSYKTFYRDQNRFQFSFYIHDIQIYKNSSHSSQPKS